MKLAIFLIVCCFIVDYSTCLADDIENLDLPALLKFSLASEENHEKANSVYKSKYGDVPVEITAVSKNSNEVYVSSSGLIYMDAGQVENYFKAFGDSVKKLSVAYHKINSKWHKEIGKHINEHCADTLVEFKAEHSEEDAFDNVTKPFTKVENLEFEGRWQNLSDNKGLDELFPEVRVLNLTYTEGYILSRVFPKVEELKANVDPSPAFFNFLTINAQLKKLHLKKTSIELLQVVNQNLTNLEVFDFEIPSELPSYNGTAIELEHIKESSIRDNDHYIRADKILFKQLKKLELSIFGRLDAEVANFIGSNKQLENLVITFGNLNDTTLLILASKLKHLVEADIRCELDISTENIVKFIKLNTKLQKIILNFPGNTDSILKELSGQFSKDWTVEIVRDSYGIKISQADPSGASFIVSSTALTLTVLLMAVKGIVM